MPQIAEIKTIDGQVWVRVELKPEPGALTSIALYTPKELKERDRDTLIGFCVDLIDRYIGPR